MARCAHLHRLHIPGAEELQLDRLVAVQAACQVTTPDRDAQDVKHYASEFTRWLKDGYDATDRAIRRQVLLTVTADLEGTTERPAKIVKLADELRSYVG